ncbi:MAG: hypothetical protein GY941_14065 [Planctomycetes bacterium]|nr:hypothetical protein [Planctomycetota bacterium]
MRTKGTTAIDPIPEGKFPGVVCGDYGIGEQPSEYYNPKDTVCLEIELPTVFDDEGQPRRITTGRWGYKNTAHPNSNLRRDVEIIIDREYTKEEEVEGFDLDELLGLNVYVRITHTDNGHHQIKCFQTYPESDDPIVGSRELIAYDFYGDAAIPEATPDYIKKWIEEAINYKGEVGADHTTQKPATQQGRRTVGMPQKKQSAWERQQQAARDAAEKLRNRKRDQQE